MKKTFIQTICAIALLLAFNASDAQDAAQTTPAATDNDVQWKSYPTAQPGWHASVAYVNAFINDFEQYQEYLTAPCGDSGEVAYVSGYGVPISPSLSISKIDMRTGRHAEYVFTLSEQDLTSAPEYGAEKYSDPMDLQGIACSADGRRVAVFLEQIFDKDSNLKKTFLLDLKTLKAVSLGETKISGRVGVDGRLIDPSFSLLVGGHDRALEAEKEGIRILPLETLQAAVAKYHGEDSRAVVFVEKDSVSTVVSNPNDHPEKPSLLKKPPISFIRMGGTNFTEIQSCNIKEYESSFAQPAPGGAIITVYGLKDPKKWGRYYLKMGKVNGGACELQPIGTWGAFYYEFVGEGGSRQIDAYAGDASFGIQAKDVLPASLAGDASYTKTLEVNFTLLKAGRGLPLFSPQIIFYSLDNWYPVGNQLTFVYGPRGQKTAFVHFWETNSR